ncbi:putative permease [Granulicella aggregans]|uniref:Putative permease n=1 Tax=Granulicella aggregans TaxID=474949 RepID=A0A7W8E7H6_9BACT|nr:ADOP family duplicated permease [Granulicella aggregans]MBB5060275.1 putative permease [Granulicella aggregans]
MFNTCKVALRQLKRSAGFSFTVILILAIGIGVTTAMYSVLYAVVLQPLPFPEPDRLVAISAKPWDNFSFPTLLDWQRRTHSFQSIAAYAGWSPRIESTAGVGHAEATLVSKNFLSTLGASLSLGHDFTETGNEADCLDQAIVTDAYWHRMGGGNSLTGRTLQLDHKTYAVIGVLAPIETGGNLDGSAVLTPLSCDQGKSTTDRGDSAFQGIGRLRPGVSLEKAAAELATAQGQMRHDFPNLYPDAYTPVPMPYADHEVGTGTRSALFATLAACGTLLLIACANITNLLLARNTRRRAEFAVRATLGARPRHLLGQLLAENCTLATAGALLGMFFSDLLVRAAQDAKVVHLPRLGQASLNFPALAFVAAVTMLVAILLTILPAMRSLRPALLVDLSNGSARTSGSKGLRRAGRLLVASQLALALAVVASAGWMVSSVFILLHQPLGFDPNHLLFASTDLRSPVRDPNSNPARTLAVLNETLASLRAVPGIEAVAAANDKPLGGRVNQYDFCSDLHPEVCNQPHLKTPDVFQVTPGYFQTMSQLLYRGRDFNTADDGRNHVVIVNRALANQEWPGESPIGHRIFTGELKSWATVVGEVDDVHSYSLERAPRPNLYLPEADGPDVHMTLMMRTGGDPAAIQETIRSLLHTNSQITTNYVQSIPEMMAHQVALRRFSMQIALAFGTLALVLAVFGTYGLLAYEVSLREREMGIRLALGSTRAAIVSLLLRQESRWIAGGILSGLLTASMVGFVLRAQFFHTGATSVPVLITSSLLLAVPALLAVAVPGRRASLLEPSITLRRE